MSNSVFLNEKLAATLTGKNFKAKKRPASEVSFMNSYGQKAKANKNATSKPAQADSDEEDSKARSVGKNVAKKPFGAGYTKPKHKQR